MPLMGWLSAADTLSQLTNSMSFKTQEEAVRVAERNGGYRVRGWGLLTVTLAACVTRLLVCRWCVGVAGASLPRRPGWRYEIEVPQETAKGVVKSYAYNFLSEVCVWSSGVRWLRSSLPSRARGVGLCRDHVSHWVVRVTVHRALVLPRFVWELDSRGCLLAGWLRFVRGVPDCLSYQCARVLSQAVDSQIKLLGPRKARALFAHPTKHGSHWVNLKRSTYGKEPWTPNK